MENNEKKTALREIIARHLEKMYAKYQTYEKMPENKDGYYYIEWDSYIKIADSLIPMIKNATKNPSPDKCETATGEKLPLMTKEEIFEHNSNAKLYSFDPTPPKGIEAGKGLEEWKDEIMFYDLNAHERYKALEELCVELYASQQQGSVDKQLLWDAFRAGKGDNYFYEDFLVWYSNLPQPPSNKL